MSEDLTPCIACDCLDDDMYYTLDGAGPFCAECWGSLTDPDQTLLLEKRLEKAEQALEERSDQRDEIERLKATISAMQAEQKQQSTYFKAIITQLADALENWPRTRHNETANWIWPFETHSKLIQKARDAAKQASSIKLGWTGTRSPDPNQEAVVWQALAGKARERRSCRQNMP